MERQGTRLERPEERAGLEQRFRQLTGRIEDEVVRRHYFTSLKDRIWQEYNRSRKASSGAKPWAHSGGKYSNAPASSQLAPRSGASESVNAAGLQEEILMATVITHPEILDRVDDNLGSTSFLSPALDKMRQEVLKAVSNAEGLDSEALKNHLYEAGFGDALDGLLSRRVYDHARFARPDQPSTDAEKGWEQLYRLYRRTQLLEEIRAVEARLKAEPTRETFETLKTLKVQVSTMDEDAGPVEMLRKSKTDTAA